LQVTGKEIKYKERYEIKTVLSIELGKDKDKIQDERFTPTLILPPQGGGDV